SQPWLIVAPLIQAFAEQGSAYLLGARGAHAAFGLMELDTGGLELQPAVIENASHVALEVIDEIFVLHAQHASGQDGIPMPHEDQVGAVVAGNVRDAVG